MWNIYILECCDGSYYTGMTSNLEFRLRYHNEGKACRYTRTRRPVRLRYIEDCGERFQAMKREREIKKYSRFEKEHLMKLQKPGVVVQSG